MPGVVGLLTSDGQNVIVSKSERFVEDVETGRCAISQKFTNGFDGETRGDFASVVTTHAVGHDKETAIGIDEERVFVRGPAARMGDAMGRQRHGPRL
jgi:hypothetical protein